LGKQRSGVLKTKAKKIYKILKDQFNEEFEHNKKVLKDLHLFDYSPRERNLVAGFVTKLFKTSKKQKTA